MQACDVAGPGTSDGQTVPNSSSKRSPNHASKTAISASVTGTRSGQSSMTAHVSRSCLGGRPGKRHGSLSSASSCSDAVGSWARDGRGIAPESAIPHRCGTTHLCAPLRCVPRTANTGDRRSPAAYGRGIELGISRWILGRETESSRPNNQSRPVTCGR